MQSELYGFTWRGFLVTPICRMLLPFLLLRYKEFWGLRCAALGAKNRLWRAFVSKCYHLYVSKHGAEIPLSVKMDGPPLLPHGVNGIFIGALTHLGKNVTILQQVTIGEDTFSSLEDNAHRFIGNNVFIGAGAKIIGGVSIGANCRIGANACVYRDMPPNSVAVMQPTRIIPKENLVNYFRRGNRVWENGGWVEKGTL